ncbi:MAG: hypothetical protein ACTHNS_13370 [Marmoricola sp.]
MAASTLALVLAGVALLGVVLAFLALVLALRSERRRTAELVAHLSEHLSGQLSGRLDAASEGLDRRAAAVPEPRAQARVAEFVITDLGSSPEPVLAAPVADRVVLSATLGEPLVRGVAFAHGLRRALSAESRNRIRFEVRREIRRSRRRRRQEMKDAWRRVRAEDGTAA